MEASQIKTTSLGGAAVTPADGADIATQGTLYVGGTGALKVTTSDGSVLTFAAVPVGFFPVKVKRVWATGTTATNIIAVY